MTEEEALSILTAHLSPPEDKEPASLPQVSERAGRPQDIIPKTKARLRSPPPQRSEPVEPTDQGSPPVSDSPPVNPVEAETSSEASELHPQQTRPLNHQYEEEDSMDEFMVEKMIANIAEAADTPAPPSRHIANNKASNPDYSVEAFSDDPFKSRPKVALSPPLTPYHTGPQWASGGLGGGTTTPRVNSSEWDDEEENDDSETSPLKTRGRRNW